MTRFMAVSILLVTLSSAAIAQEQQVYYPPYLAQSGLTQQDLINRQNYIIMQEQARLQGNYIERDPTVTYQDRLGQHPGDYRDAYDRGELPRLGGYSHKTGKPISR
jgi:hypothetical protein